MSQQETLQGDKSQLGPLGSEICMMKESTLDIQVCDCVRELVMPNIHQEAKVLEEISP